MAGDAPAPDRALAILFRLMMPNAYGLIHLWIPLAMATLLFYLCSPGVLMIFSGSSFQWTRPSASTRRLARWHALVYALALFLLIVFLALVPRAWPGAHPYDAIAVRSSAVE
jgi:cell division protein FtsW (lipid II flippase)